MTRITATILVFMVLLNGSVSMMAASGLSEDLGVTLAPGVEQAIDETIDDLDEFSTSEGLGDNLFSLFSSAMGVGEILAHGVFSMPSMLLNLGFPGWIVYPLFAPMYILSTLELVSMASGRNMI